LIRNDRLPDKKIKELPDTYKYHLVIVNFLWQIDYSLGYARLTCPSCIIVILGFIFWEFQHQC
jgi:hypothetical protein